ncbi:MAG: ImmA/IrrE family metallo-endopeptidase [Bacteroidetes bacterium]|nr:ImmA/IrrE family metallo-endopeptidase [Bacteroidota bacterium]
MQKQINRNYIILARESRGLSQVEFATKLGMSPANLSKIEQGMISIDDSYINEFVNILGYPESFYRQEQEIKQSFMSYRKRQIVSPKLLTPIDAKMNVLRLHVELLMKELQFNSAELPILNPEKIGTPQKCAIKLRKLWDMKEGVVDNITKLIESKGVIIDSFTFGTDRVDSRTMLSENNQPIIFTNKSLLGDRLRFSLAYELGHLIMHLATSPNFERDISHEANLFSAEFLMPETAIRPDFEGGITISTLSELKKKWKVSMQSLLYRADDLGYLTYNQKRYILTQFNQMKIRKREPEEFDVAKEAPSLLKNMIVKYKTKYKSDNAQLAERLNLGLSEFIEIYS